MSEQREMMAKIERGIRLESADEMTPEYRDNLVHLMTMQADSELDHQGPDRRGKARRRPDRQG